MDTSPIVGPGQTTSDKAFKSDFDLEDWKDLRDLATKSKKTFDGKKNSPYDLPDRLFTVSKF